MHLPDLFLGWRTIEAPNEERCYGGTTFVSITIYPWPGWLGGDLPVSSKYVLTGTSSPS
jgi:hypothetical protein